jgi:glycosyltransferase involved in cell wall biosynthesis
MAELKISVLIPYYGNRRVQLANTMRFYNNQTYENYEIILVNDGAIGGLPELGDKFKLITLRDEGAPIRASNMAYHAAFEESDGDFIVVCHPEILIPYDALEQLIENADMSRRNVATQFYLTSKQVAELKTIPGWEEDFDKIKHVADFWNTQTPWCYTNKDAVNWHNHFSFSGSIRERFEEYMIPKTEEWCHEDVYVHELEMERGELSVYCGIEVYHQEHPRVWPHREHKSVRIERIEQSNL